MSEPAIESIYQGVRARVTELVRSQSDEALNATAPATPEWRVRDIVAHLSGNIADILAGNLEGVATDPWTQAQVDARRETPIEEILEEWATGSEIVAPMIAGIDPMSRTMLLADAVTHEHDLRHALGEAGARDSDAIEFAFAGIAAGVGAQRADAGALRIVHDAGETVVGTGDVAATVRTSRFEIVRAGVGRRSLDQIAGWDWDGHIQPSTMVLGRFSPPRPTPLSE